LFAYGNHWDIGFTMGTTFQKQIKDRLNNFDTIQDLKKWVKSTDFGKETYRMYLFTNNQTFPEYVIELEAMAKGAEVNFEDLFILNMRNEFMNAKDEYTGYMVERRLSRSYDSRFDDCSDYMTLDTLGNPVLAHNEDGDVFARGTSFLLWAKIFGPGVREEVDFVALVYPGELATNAFFANKFGVAGSLNGLYPKLTYIGGLGRLFISRDLLGSRNDNEALQRICRPGQSIGHNYNIIFCGSCFNQSFFQSPVLISVETAPNITNLKGVPRYSTAHFDQNGGENAQYLFHANSYLRLNVEEMPDKITSSEHRMKRAAEIGRADGWDNILKILGDTKDISYPIYRTASPPDTGFTLMTVAFKLNEQKIEIYLENPDPDKGNKKSKISLSLEF